MKEIRPAELLDVIRTVAAGESLLPPGPTSRPIARFLRAPNTATASAVGGPSGLSERERQVLALVARGLNNAEIADALGLSPLTAKVSVVNLKTNKVAKTVPIGDIPPVTGSGRFFRPSKVALTPDGKSAYVVGSYGNGTSEGTVFAINTATNAVTPITVGAGDTMGVAVGRL